MRRLLAQEQAEAAQDEPGRDDLEVGQESSGQEQRLPKGFCLGADPTKKILAKNLTATWNRLNISRNKVALFQPPTTMNKYKLGCFKFDHKFFDLSRMLQL